MPRHCTVTLRSRRWPAATMCSGRARIIAPHVDRHPLPPRRRRSSMPTATRWWQRARAAGVATAGAAGGRGRATSTRCASWRTAHGLAYALGIHPLCVDAAGDADLRSAARRAARAAATTRGWWRWARSASTTSCPGSTATRQERFYVAQLKLARDAGLPVILHVRRSADGLLARPAPHRRSPAASRMRSTAARSRRRPSSSCGFRLGFGGAMTFERALQIRRAGAPRCRPTALGAGDRCARHPAALAVPHRGAARRRRDRSATSRPSCRASPQTLAAAARLELEQTAAAHRRQRAAPRCRGWPALMEPT